MVYGVPGKRYRFRVDCEASHGRSFFPIDYRSECGSLGFPILAAVSGPR